MQCKVVLKSGISYTSTEVSGSLTVAELRDFLKDRMGRVGQWYLALLCEDRSTVMISGPEIAAVEIYPDVR